MYHVFSFMLSFDVGLYYNSVNTNTASIDIKRRAASSPKNVPFNKRLTIPTLASSTHIQAYTAHFMRNVVHIIGYNVINTDSLMLIFNSYSQKLKLRVRLLVIFTV